VKILSIDVGTYEIKFCMASVRKKDFQIHRVLKVPTPDAKVPLDDQMDEVIALISKTIKENKLTGERLVVGLPSALCSFRFISVPFIKRKKIEQVLSYEVEDIVPFSAEELIIDYQIVSQEKGNSELFLAMVPQVNYDNYLTAFIEHHMEPDIVMPDTVAYSVFCEKFIPQSETATVLVDIGHNHSSLTYVRDGKMEYVRPIPFGYVSFSENIKSATQYTQEEVDALVQGYDNYTDEQKNQYQEIIDQAMTQLVVEVNQTMIAYKAKTRHEIGEILVSGGFGKFPYIVPTLAAELNLKVHPISKIMGAIDSHEEIDISLYATVIGYAARYSMANPQHYINFRRKETKTQKILEQMKKKLETPESRNLVRIIAVILILFIPYIIVKSVITDMHYEESKKDIDRLVRKVVAGNVSKSQRENYIDNPDELLGFLKKSLQSESLKVSVFEQKQHSPVALLHKLMKQKPEDLQIDVPRFEFQQEKMMMTVSVVSGDIQQYINRIKTSPLFTSFEVTELSKGEYEFHADLKQFERGSNE
jgi:Tfp pilus assembly PilM family ATPase